MQKRNKDNKVAVKTPFGLTDRVKVEKIVLQGETFGPLQCSVQVKERQRYLCNI